MADDDAKPAAAAAAAAADDDSDVEMSGECVETPRGLGGVRDTSCARYLFARWSTKICGPCETKGNSSKTSQWTL